MVPLPEHEELEEVRREDNASHAGQEEQQPEVVPTLVFLPHRMLAVALAQVGRGEEHGQEAERAREQEQDRGERVEQHAEDGRVDEAPEPGQLEDRGAVRAAAAVDGGDRPDGETRGGRCHDDGHGA